MPQLGRRHTLSSALRHCRCSAALFRARKGSVGAQHPTCCGASPRILGRRVRFAVTTIVGNGNGVVGLGRVSGKLVRPTITKALDRAKLNIIEIRRGSGSWECSTAVPNSLPFEVSGRTGSTRVTIKPAPPGVGLVTNQVGQIMLRLAGVEDAWSFTKGQTQTIYNFASAMFKALEKTSTTKLLPGQDDFHNMIKGVKQE